MAIRPSNTRMNVNATRAVSVKYAVSHDPVNCWPEKTLKSETSFFSGTGDKKRHWIVANLLKVEAVLGMIYMSIGVLIGLLHRQIYAGEWCIAGFILTEDVLVEKAVVF